MLVIVKVRKNTWPGQRFTLLVIIVLEKALAGSNLQRDASCSFT